MDGDLARQAPAAEISAESRPGWRVRQTRSGAVQRVATKAPRQLSDEFFERARITPRSFALPVADGEYAPIPSWGSRDQWLAAKDVALSSPEGAALREAWTPRKKWVRREVLDRVAVVLAEAADHQNGRNITVSRRTIAVRAGLLESDVHERTPEGKRLVQAASKMVSRVLEILSALDLHRVVVIGRLLSQRERAWLASKFGIAQARAASVRALSVPKRFAQALGVHLPRSSRFSEAPPVKNMAIKRRKRRSTAAPRPLQGKMLIGRRNKRTAPPTAGFRRLVAQLDTAVTRRDGRVVGRFTQGQSTMALMRLLEEFGVNESWSADELLERVLRWKPGYELRNGLGWVRARLRRHFGGPEELASMPPQFARDRELQRAWMTDPEFRRTWVIIEAQRDARDAERAAEAAASSAMPSDEHAQAWAAFVAAIDRDALERERFTNC